MYGHTISGILNLTGFIGYIGELKMTTNIDENIKSFRQIYSDCSDIKMQEMYLGRDASIKCFVAYIEVTCAGSGINNSAFGRFTSYLEGIDRDQVKEVLDKNQAALSEFAHLHTVNEAAQMMLTGDVIFFVDGYPDAFKLPDKGYPAMSIQEIDSEKVIRGSNEGFADSIKINTALIRRRLRSTRLKCKEVKKVLRGHSNVDILYVRDLVKPGLVEDVERNLDSYVIDHVGDSGVLEQFAEAKWYSPFPQYQTTERPDRAVQEILKGKVVILCDNSPEALILPGNFSSFMESSEDWYHRFEMASFLRILRYLAVIMATVLPGLYLAVIRFHTQILPSALILSFAEAREGVPFSSVVELIFLELAFELIREAGVRVPGSLGNAIGIVGGLVIGQAAVEANLVSPIVVMIVALTALGSMTVPNEEFAAAFRLVKYGFLILGGYLGIYGIVLGVYLVIGHLAGLISFGIPYLVPFIKKEQKGSRGEGVLRVPLRKRVLRPLYAREEQKIRLKRKESGS